MKKVVVILFVAFMVPLKEYAQSLGEAILDIDGIVSDILGDDYAKAKTSLWGSILDSEAESEVRNKAAKLSKHTIDKSSLSQIDKSYGLYSMNNLYSNVYPKLFRHFDKCFNNTHNLKFSALGGGVVGDDMRHYRDSVAQLSEIASLSSVLTQQVLDSVKAKKYPNQFETLLLADIRNNEFVASVLNNHPESVGVYKKLSNVNIGENASALLYWGKTVPDFRSILPIKIRKKVIDAETVDFKKANNTVEILSAGERTGCLKDGIIKCDNLDLMNIKPMPNMEYQFGGTRFITDCAGRVVRVEQIVNVAEKSKCSCEGKLKSKQLSCLKSTEEMTLLCNPALLSYGAPDCFLNLVYFKKTESNKEALKQLKKQIKNLKKSGRTSVTLVSTLYYNGGSDLCCRMVMQLGSEVSCILENN